MSPCEDRIRVSNEIRLRSELKINENLARDMEKTGLSLPSMDVVSSRLEINPNGHTSSISIGFAFGFGMTFEFGTVSDGYGDEKSFHTISGNAGLGIEFGINESQITPNEEGTPFMVDNYQGIGSQWDLSLFFANFSIGGDHNGGYFNSPNRFSYEERSVGITPFTSFPTNLKGQLGVMYKISSTRLSVK